MPLYRATQGLISCSKFQGSGWEESFTTLLETLNKRLTLTNEADFICIQVANRTLKRYCRFSLCQDADTGIAFERDHHPRVEQQKGTCLQAGQPRARTAPHGARPGPCPAPRAQPGPARPIRGCCCCAHSLTSSTRSPSPLLPKTSRSLLVPEAAPRGPARLSPSPGPRHRRRGPRGPGPHTRRGRGGSRRSAARRGAAAPGGAAQRRHRSGPDVALPGGSRSAPAGGARPGRPRGSRRGRIPRAGESGARRRGAAAGAGKGPPAPRPPGGRGSEELGAEVWGRGGARPRPGYLKTQSSRASLAGEISPCFLLKSFWKRVGGILGRCRCPRRRGAGLRAAPSLRRG